MATAANAEVIAYLQELQSKETHGTSTFWMLQKCVKTVKSTRSPLDPVELKHFKNFGPYILRRVEGHFSKSENTVQHSLQAATEELEGSVRDELRRLIEDEHFGRSKSKTLQGILDGLVVFQPLQDIRDLQYMKACSQDILQNLEAKFPPKRKAKAIAAGGSAAASKRRKGSAVPGLGLSGRVVSAASPQRPQNCRGHRKQSGPWAILVALHIAGEPQSKDQLDKLSAQHRLCKEPLVRKQRTVAHVSQYYSPWSGMSNLLEKRWVSKSKGLYSLTDDGKVEAQRYYEQFQEETPHMSDNASQQAMAASGEIENFSGVAGHAQKSNCAESSVPDDLSLSESLSHSDFSDAFSDDDICLVRSSSSRSSVPLWSGIKSKAQTDSSHVACSTSQQPWKRPRWAKGVLQLQPSGVQLQVLMDLREKPIIRERLSQQFSAAPAFELNLPGIDYAFGRPSDGDWSLGEVLLERKTVFDYLDTLGSARGRLQEDVQRTLRAQSFRVATIIEGTNNLARHPQEQELLMAAHSGPGDVLVTASVDDTAELLLAMAESMREHDGWTLNSLGVLVKTHYEADPRQLCESALVLLGVTRQVASAVASCFGNLSELLADTIPDAGCDVETGLQSLASTTNLTLYQAGLLLRALGMYEAPLLRTRRLKSKDSQMSTADPESVADGCRADEDVDVTAQVGKGFNRSFLRSMEAYNLVTDDHLDRGEVRISCNSESRLFHVGDSLESKPWRVGCHYLLISKQQNWAQLTKKRARAYAERGIPSSLCTSIDQAARHIVACARALETAAQSSEAAAQASEAAAPGSNRGLVVKKGLAGVLGLSRTAGGLLPDAVASALAAKLEARQAGASVGGIAALVRSLRRHGEAWLLDLGVTHFGPERAAAVKALLLG